MSKHGRPTTPTFGFVRNIGVKTSDAVIVEGVETEAQRLFPEQYGCRLPEVFVQ
ncbi:hypothetical protein [Methylomonas albis]|uniref:Uncharacterized protein n=1 Tax=Methylomonas albis TaxID=1854563 RepID=A0ABR9D1Z1_9GAMM|nr:hypothetical protein [Methylomonas albis]MBD9357118.1 hypothetical protein [Methylomonas albis]